MKICERMDMLDQGRTKKKGKVEEDEQMGDE